MTAASASMTTSQMPPMIWLTMTPELPRADSRMARLRVWHSRTRLAVPRMPAPSWTATTSSIAASKVR